MSEPTNINKYKQDKTTDLGDLTFENFIRLTEESYDKYNKDSEDTSESVKLKLVDKGDVK